MNKQTDKQTNS